MFNDLYEINNKLFADRDLQTINIPKAKTIAVDAFKFLAHTPKHILAVNDTWMSRALESVGLDVTLLARAKDSKKFDTVIAMDEVFTHANSELEQKKKIIECIQRVSPGGVLLASIRDYKNTNCHKKLLGDTIMTQVEGERWVTTEVNNLDEKNKQRWMQNLYLIKNDTKFANISLGYRHTLYFKQLAKYCADNQSKSFGVLKDILWKSPLRKQFEYITWAKF